MGYAKRGLDQIARKEQRRAMKELANHRPRKPTPKVKSKRPAVEAEPEVILKWARDFTARIEGGI